MHPWIYVAILATCLLAQLVVVGGLLWLLLGRHQIWDKWAAETITSAALLTVLAVFGVAVPHLFYDFSIYGEIVIGVVFMSVGLAASAKFFVVGKRAMEREEASNG